MTRPSDAVEASTEVWERYRWPEIEMRWSGEDAAFLCRWREFPSALVDGPTREDAFAALMSLTPTFMLVLADLPHADVRDTATVAQKIARDLEARVEALEALTNSGPPLPVSPSEAPHVRDE